jgi:hypothetical protein
MKTKHILLVSIVLAALSCRKGNEPKPIPPPAPGVIRLKDVNIAHLPNPYYHFVYDNAGLITAASYSDSMAFYDVFYNANKKISRMQNKSFGNRDVLNYQYDNGDVSVITITNEAGVIYAHGFFDYNYTHQLINVEWEVKAEGGFLIERTLDLSYTADGNVKDIVTHIHAMDGQPAVTFTTTYSNYDDKKNVDGFSLLHPDQFHHLYLLPGVKLQLNNHRREVRTGDVSNYTVDYTYTYDSKGRPTIQNGDFQWTSGSDAGKHTPLHTGYSYYD